MYKYITVNRSPVDAGVPTCTCVTDVVTFELVAYKNASKFDKHCKDSCLRPLCNVWTTVML